MRKQRFKELKDLVKVKQIVAEPGLGPGSSDFSLRVSAAECHMPVLALQIGTRQQQDSCRGLCGGRI